MTILLCSCIVNVINKFLNFNITQSQNAKYLKDIADSNSDNLEALIKRLTLEKKCDKETTEIVKSACKRMAHSNFNSSGIQYAIKAFAEMQGRLSTENINELEDAIRKIISRQQSFSGSYVADLSQSFRALGDILKEKEKEQKRLPDSNLIDLNPSEINPNTVNRATENAQEFPV